MSYTSKESFQVSPAAVSFVTISGYGPQSHIVHGKISHFQLKDNSQSICVNSVGNDYKTQLAGMSSSVQMSHLAIVADLFSYCSNSLVSK